MEQRFFAPGWISAMPAWERAPTGLLRIAETAVPEPAQPSHDPPLAPRDEAVFLLTAAAEIEHALLVQYLYGAYSVRVPVGAARSDPIRQVRELLTEIAREEMAHLVTVQNLLHLLGGAVNLNREHSPYASQIYPFRFKLEPLSLDSLAKYVTAESPQQLPPELPEADKQLLEKIRQDAVRSNDGHEVHHVGPIFQRLAYLVENVLADEDFQLDTFGRQAKAGDWRFEPEVGRSSRAPNSPGDELIIASFPDADPARLRAAAAAAVRKIGAQGEGYDLDPTGPESHFERFFDIYQRVRQLSGTGTVITWPVAENPNTTTPPPQQPALADMVGMVREAHASKGRITDPRARAWAQLFNLRYRMLLARLSHFLRLDQALYLDSPAALAGDRSARGLLLAWTFDEMRRLAKIASKLVQLPKDSPPGPVHAGPPFELPYTLNLPEGEPQRWRTHLDAVRAAGQLIREHLQPGEQAQQPDGFLDDLLRADAQDEIIMQALAAGRGIPPGSLPAGFGKAVRILEEAIRGFTIGPPHANFWAGKTREAFLSVTVAGVHPVERHPDGTVNPDPNAAHLVRRLEGSEPPPANRMPRFRPPVPAQRIGFIRHWISEGCPDSDPPGQVGVTHERDPAPEAPPGAPPEGPPGPPSFEADIKGLFRERPDRVTMLSVGGFDLHRYQDVVDHADAILARLEDGTMPCDGSWPAERIALFRAWIAGGKQP
jgi:rubrerythrin